MVAMEELGSASNLLGYLGASIVVTAYFLNQRGLLNSGSWRFPATNLFGSVLVMASLLHNFNPPSFVIEVFWSSISLYGIRKSLRAAR